MLVRYLPIIFLFLISCFLAPRGEAAIGIGKDVATGTLVEEHMSNASGGVEMDLLRWGDASFHSDLAQRVLELSQEFGSRRSVVLLDVAELYLSKMMLFEAAGIAQSIRAKTLPAEQRSRLNEIVDAIEVLRGKPVDRSGGVRLLGGKRQDRQFWAVMEAISTGNAQGLIGNIEGAFENRKRVPRAVLRSVMPAIIEAMIEVGKFGLSERAIPILESFPEYANSPVSQFLRGREAERQGKLKTAFDHYFLASEGWDRYAARARLRLADMALKNGSLGALRAAKEILENGVNAWRGDRYELITLTKLVEVDKLLGKNFKALLVSGRIISGFPHSDRAKMARVFVQNELRNIYRDGAAGKISISDWVSKHKRLAPLYRQLPEFADYSETLADNILKLGGTDFALAEYQRAISLIRLRYNQKGPMAGRRGQEQKNEDRIARIQIKMATALISSGRYKKAKALLSKIRSTGSEILEARKKSLEVKVYADLGDVEAVIENTADTNSETELRKRAYAFWQKGDWDHSAAAYQRLWEKYPRDFTVEDGSYLLLASQRRGDVVTATAVVRAFPKLTDSKELISIAERFLDKPADISVLSNQAIRKRIDSVARTLDDLRANGL